MNKYSDLESSILCCLLIKPELMNELKLEDKHFVNNKQIWGFMKSFYKKFKNFDITLMCSLCKNRKRLMRYIIDLLELEPTSSNFDLYQQQLIDLYNEEEKDKWIIEKVYKATCDLWVRNITTREFILKITDIYQNANEIFKGE